MNRARWLLIVVGTIGIGVLTYELVVRSHGAQALSADEARLQMPAATVEKRTISSRTSVDGTLGYGGDYSVVNQLAGYFTWLPAADEASVVAQGDVLYRVGTLPVVLLRGSIPAWRDLSQGDSGADVKQLNDDLLELGFLEERNLESDEHFGPSTQAAVQALQRKIGANPSGALPLGSVVFLPSPIRVVSVLPALGARADTNSVIMKATSTSRQVAIHLSASQLGRVKVGDDVTITLNFGGSDQRVVGGRISKIFTTADPGSGSNGDTPTFEVHVIPADRSPLGDIDQMPVQVGITDATAEDALVVPVTALLSTPDQGHVVEVLGSNGSRTFVPVHLGVFDDADGLVQVTGEGLSAGDKVVVPTL
jgi:peptidoglycan hydrolase-like protein with peptidoglycan-binding domain